MSRIELYEGYKHLLQKLYDYRNYRQRTMALILSKGADIQSKLLGNRHDLGIFFRVLWTCILRASPRRAWMTLSMMIETAWRRPQQFRLAIMLALMHKHFYEYVAEISIQLDRLIEELRTLPDPGMLPRPAAQPARVA